MSDFTTIGLIATYKSGIRTLKASGQDSRLVRYYLKAYATRFNRIYYFSYLQESLADYTDDPEILSRVQLLPKRWNVPDPVYALLMPLAYPKEFSRCRVLRVFQALGAYPLWAAVILGIPSLVTFGYRYSEFARVDGKRFWKVASIAVVERLAVWAATVALVTTRELHSFVCRVRTGPVALIPNGVDLDSFRPATPPVKFKEKTVLFVGRFERQKNLETLVYAAAEARQRVPLRLLWIGHGSQTETLRHLAQTLGVPLEIRPPVPHHELNQVMAEADAFTLVSWTEGHPKVLMEAMASGLPCIVSNCDGNRLLIENGKSGLVCDPRNRKEISEAIERVLKDNDLRKQLGMEARNRVRCSYDLKFWVDREGDILRTLADGGFSSNVGRRGHILNRWLDYSVRRRLLDADLLAVTPELTGEVLEVGGGRRPTRGRFLRPFWQVRSWTMLDKNPDVKPDLMADAATIPLPDASLDTVLCLEVLEYVAQPQKAIAEFSRVLRPGGRLVLSVPRMHWRDHDEDRWRFDTDELASIVSHAGLNLMSIQRQGGLLAGLAHMIKSMASRRHKRLIREIVGITVFIPTVLLAGIDRFFAKWTSGRWTTGYLLLAQKP